MTTEQCEIGGMTGPVAETRTVEFADLLHSEIAEAALSQFIDGHFRDAVLNAVMAVFGLIRKRTELEGDGPGLVGKAFSLDDPYLVLSELETETGRNDQKGFMQILQGAYLGVRNPKAHSLELKPDKIVAAQYLVFASLLARRVANESLAKTVRTDPPSI